MSTLHQQTRETIARPLSKTDRAILEYMDSVKKDYYDEEIAGDSRFQVWYQLSVLRTGLLSWYEFEKGARVLEIGAGFGALTGLLCDKCGYVAATERSPVRAEALARRWKEKENLHVYPGEWSEIEFGTAFDYIILTGILERACGGSKDRKDYVDYLRKVSRLLCPGGILLAAADNRLGLKYFCGARESHGGNAFEGINHYPRGTRGYSFDRQELKDIVATAGFGEMQFYYPLPDYKLPQLIYTDSYLPEQNLRERLIPYYENHHSLVAVEQDLYRDVIANGVFPFFANSFLIECRRMAPSAASVGGAGGAYVSFQTEDISAVSHGSAGEAESPAPAQRPVSSSPTSPPIPPPLSPVSPPPMSPVVYAAVSTDRGRERAFATVIRRDGKVRKTPLFPEGREGARKLFDNIQDLKAHGIPVVEHRILEDGSLELPFVSWPTLSNYIKETIKQDTDAFVGLVDRIYTNILESSEQAPAEENALLRKLYRENFGKESANAGLASGRNEEDGIAGERLPEGSPSAGNPSAPHIPDFGPILKNAYMELIPLNCFYHPETKEFLYFDQEFVRENYPAKYVLFRAIHYIYCFTPGGDMYYPRKKLMERYGMTETWDIYQKEEQAFLDRVRSHEKYRQFYRWAGVNRERVWDNAKRLRSEEEVIADYKISDKMKKIWKVELAMLEEVDRICKKYGLTYFLVHGSLLGAVRHQGFIPWDDDLDIAMPRTDYDRFLELAPGELMCPLSLHTPESEADLFWGGFARLRDGSTTGIEARDLNHKGNLGIWIDILPLDRCTTDEDRFERKKKRIRHCHRLLLAKIYGRDYKAYWDMGPWMWRGYRLISRLYSHMNLCRMLDQAMRLYTEEESEDVAFFTGYYQHRRLNGRDFASTVSLEFEGRRCPVPAGYENYLFMSMGKDYLNYPPEDERKPKHTGIFDPEKPYGEYRQMLCGMFEDIGGKKIILFGAGMMFEDYMKKWGGRYRPDFLVDNDENKWGRSRMGIPVKSPKEILQIPEGKRRLIICSFYYKEIEKQLEEMGVKDYHVYVQHVEWIVRSEQ